MNSLSEPRSLNATKPERETFYKTYVTVIYGFVTVSGLEAFFSPPAWQAVSGTNILFFLGSLITSWHFWLICLASNDLSDSLYSVVTDRDRPRVFTAFLLTDIAFATLFAAPIIIMLRHTGDPITVIRALVALAALSFAYDILSLVIATFASLRVPRLGSKGPTRRYIQLYGSWLLQDFVYLSVAGASLALQHFALLGSLGLAGLFFSITAAGIVWDVVWRNPDVYRAIQVAAKTSERLPERSK